jgi:hypothetical protein
MSSVVDVFDALLEAQRVAGMRRCVIRELLLAVQELLVVHAQQIADGGRIGRVHFQAEQECGRYEQAGQAGGARGFFIDTQRIGLAGGLGEEAEPAGLHAHIEGRQGVADEATVDHAAAPQARW